MSESHMVATALDLTMYRKKYFKIHIDTSSRFFSKDYLGFRSVLTVIRCFSKGLLFFLAPCGFGLENHEV